MKKERLMTAMALLELPLQLVGKRKCEDDSRETRGTC